MELVIIIFGVVISILALIYGAKKSKQKKLLVDLDNIEKSLIDLRVRMIGNQVISEFDKNKIINAIEDNLNNIRNLKSGNFTNEELAQKVFDIEDYFNQVKYKVE